jgi:hypothetical protein
MRTHRFPFTSFTAGAVGYVLSPLTGLAIRCGLDLRAAGKKISTISDVDAPRCAATNLCFGRVKAERPDWIGAVCLQKSN